MRHRKYEEEEQSDNGQKQIYHKQKQVKLILVEEVDKEHTIGRDRPSLYCCIFSLLILLQPRIWYCQRKLCRSFLAYIEQVQTGVPESSTRDRINQDTGQCKGCTGPKFQHSNMLKHLNTFLHTCASASWF